MITGGAGGIGRTLTKELISLGANVVIASRNQERLQDCASELTEEVGGGEGMGSIVPVQCNIRNEEQVAHLMTETLRHFGSIDFLVNNGGRSQFCPTPTQRASNPTVLLSSQL